MNLVGTGDPLRLELAMVSDRFFDLFGRTATAGPGVGFLRNGLVIAEVAMSLILVAGAGLLLRAS